MPEKETVNAVYALSKQKKGRDSIQNYRQVYKGV